MSEESVDGERFGGVREAIKAFKAGEIDADDVRNLYGDIAGIERSIAVARAKRNQSMSFEELDEKVKIEEEILED